MIGAVLRATGAFLRMMRAARLLGRGFKLQRKGRLAEARDAFLAALDAAGAEGRGPLWFSTRLCALESLSTVAARLADEPLALCSIHEGLVLWQRSGLDRDDPRFEPIVAWEAWARDYLERTHVEPVT